MKFRTTGRDWAALAAWRQRFRDRFRDKCIARQKKRKQAQSIPERERLAEKTVKSKDMRKRKIRSL